MSAESVTKDPNRTMELIISGTLRVGVTLSLAVIAVGMVLFVVHGSGYGLPDRTGALLAYVHPRQFPHTPGQVWAGLLRLKPYAVIVAGVLLLLLTPIVRVAISIVAFALEEDLTYVLITSFVLFVLILSLVLGKAGT